MQSVGLDETEVRALFNAQVSADLSLLRPIINSNPASASAGAGTTATLTVTAATIGHAVLSYQWQRLIAGTWTNIAGATSAAYTTPVLIESDNGSQYRCQVSNAFGTTTSTAATLSVPTNRFAVRGFSSANSMVGPSNQGPRALVFGRSLQKLLSLPSGGQKVLMGSLGGSGEGWQQRTDATASGLQVFITGGDGTQPGLSLTADDIGKWFVCHFANNGSTTTLYINGYLWSHVNIAPSTPSANGFSVGGFGAFSSPDWAFADIAFSSSIMSASEIYADAQRIQGSSLVVRDLPLQTFRFNADDIVSQLNWVSRTGSLTLTRNGTLIVEAIS